MGLFVCMWLAGYVAVLARYPVHASRLGQNPSRPRGCVES